jgi:REP element-mobilizing transposase RayT
MFAVMSRPHRLDPSEYAGIRQYFLTICTNQRGRHFADVDTLALVREQFLRVAVAERFAVLAYCFMPDHLHAVVAAQVESADLHRFVRLAKQHSGFVFSRVSSRRLWQESYFERVVRSDGSLAELIRYMIENPVRAGLVETPSEYPHWGSQICSREEILELVSRECRV